MAKRSIPIDLPGGFRPLLDAVLSDLGEDFEAGIAAESVARSLGAKFERRHHETFVYDRKKRATLCAYIPDDYRPGEYLLIFDI